MIQLNETPTAEMLQAIRDAVAYAARISADEASIVYDAILRAATPCPAKKYELTNDTIEVAGVTLHRIRALKSFGDVKAGELGGYVQSESNLSQEGGCWVSGNARVYGNAQVFHDAQVYGDAWVYSDAWVYGNANVYGKADVYDYAQVSGDARVCGNSLVYGNAVVNGNTQLVDATIS